MIFYGLRLLWSYGGGFCAACHAALFCGVKCVQTHPPIDLAMHLTSLGSMGGRKVAINF